MLAPYFKSKVDRLWNQFWSAGITNPLVAVEQITYLIFLKRLEDIAPADIYEGFENCKWTHIRQEKTNVKHLVDVVFPWLRGVEARLAGAGPVDAELAGLGNRMADAYFQLDPAKGAVLAKSIEIIDQLFSRVHDASAAQDLMGDTFEYLLNEVSSAGTNGQFRTPRHIIRFLVDLLAPKPGELVIDPAAGTGGFLFSAHQHLKRELTSSDTLKIEWDGAIQNATANEATKKQKGLIYSGKYFVGLDNDRTMARIGWMNMVLHGIRDPKIVQGDSLSNWQGKPHGSLISPQQYDVVFANPPFTGTVDRSDVAQDAIRFPRGKAKKGDSNPPPITEKTELLFGWLLLDLLKVGGRCAVIVPEGVLFGTTDAHVKLRRELLTKHHVSAVISLPSGVFLPYTGVKTSVLVFEKITSRKDSKLAKFDHPLTEEVWFYEVAQDAFTLDAKRNPREELANDLWDALYQFRQRANGARKKKPDYAQPKQIRQRWRLVQLIDENGEPTAFGRSHGADALVRASEGLVRPIHELFSDLPSDPKAAEAQVKEFTWAFLVDAIMHMYQPAVRDALRELAGHDNQLVIDRKAVARRHLDLATVTVKRALKHKDLRILFETASENVGWRLFSEAAEQAHETAYARLVDELDRETISTGGMQERDLKEIATEFAKLDGFDVCLQAHDEPLLVSPAETIKHWTVKVRDWVRDDEWHSPDRRLRGSHVKNRVRPEYVSAREAEGLYDPVTGKLRDEAANWLDPDCIEANDWSLSAGRYKPFDFSELKSKQNAAELIKALQTTEGDIQAALSQLLAMVEQRL